MYVHGDNLELKENHKTKYRDPESRRYLREIRAKYNEWKLANQELVGPLIEKTNQDSGLLKKRVNFLNEYKDFFWNNNTMLKNLILGQIYTHLCWQNLCTTFLKI